MHANRRSRRKPVLNYLCGSNDEEYDARSAGFSLNGKGNSRYQQQLIQLKIGD